MLLQFHVARLRVAILSTLLDSFKDHCVPHRFLHKSGMHRFLHKSGKIQIYWFFKGRGEKAMQG